MDDVDIDRLWSDPQFCEILKYLKSVSEEKPRRSLNEALLYKVLWRLHEKFNSRSLNSHLGKFFESKLARNIRYRYSKTPLSTEGNSYANGRFHRKGINNPTFYLAENEVIAHAERRITGLKAVSPHLNFWVNVRLQNILDLANDNANFFSDDSEKDLILGLPYLYFNDVLSIASPTQILAEKAKKEGYEAILYRSVRGHGLCLAVFCDHLLIDSFVEVIGKEDFEDAHPNDLIQKGIL